MTLITEGEPRRDVLRVACFAESGEFTVEQGVVSPSHGERSGAPVCRFETAGKGPQEVVTFLVPPGTTLPSVERLQARGGAAFVVRDETTDDVVLVRGGGSGGAVTVDGGGRGLPDVASDGEWTMVRRSRVDGAVVEFFLLGGSSLLVGGAPLLRAPRPAEWISGTRHDGSWRVVGGAAADVGAPAGLAREREYTLSAQ